MAINEYSFISLDEIKNFIGMTGSVSDTDDLLKDLINRVSILFESYMNENVLSRVYTEYFDGKGAMVLFPNHYPITTVSGIWDDYDWDWETGDLIDADDYRIVDEQYITLKRSVSVLGDYKQNIKITYTAGYTTVPDDLKQACITEVSRMYKNRNQVDVTSKTLSDGSVSFFDKDFLPLTITTLNKYKKIGVV